MSRLRKGKSLEFDEKKTAVALYRPFCKQQFYFGDHVIDMRYQMDKFFPTPESKNLLITVNGISGTQDFSTLISDKYTDLHFNGDSQCFPMYYYEKTSGQKTLFDDVGDAHVRRDGVSYFILKRARKQYGTSVTREDIFYYVYGFLHSPAYRETFADDLKKSLPRLPLVEDADDFRAFSRAGRKLAELHLNYENAPPPEGVTVSGDRSNLRVVKMRFPAKGRRDVIVYNDAIHIENIPNEAYDYVVNGKPAIEWVMERYQFKTDKDSGIVNDPNLYALEYGQPDYILKLLLSVISVSLKTMEIVRGLPKLELEEEDV